MDKIPSVCRSLHLPCVVNTHNSYNLAANRETKPKTKKLLNENNFCIYK